MISKHRRAAVVAGAAVLALGLSACGGQDAAADEKTDTIEITDNHGTVTVPVSATSVVATDNRIFQTLDEWGIELSAAAVSLMDPERSYKNDDSIVDLGNHREPDLEALVAVQPDLVINGQRFADYYDDITGLVPDAAVVDLDPRDGEDFAAELKRQTEVLGQIFDHEEDAQDLIDAFDAAVERVKAAYDSEQTVMSVITSGSDINYSAPSVGRTLGPVFDILGLTPSIEAPEDSSGVDTGDDISVEAIADSNPDWILVMDRDAAVSANSGEAYTPADELIADSEALQNVSAVKAGNIVYMPQYTYLNEGIQTYTTFFNTIADAMEGQ
ncbi:iron complex transport system substrate-binding protein [Stackebrandtia endophytica]|uniref:Iron complex transport system substrate-binding protein n=1 Tax=Stackebrandtia endophytica TaxID=1496996 RepID=A0A543ATJ4_9ACTN|nr:ABC transporter substrate-binding protein [Stackebrandtia endophytica]TQL75907.1 iron complex transport system substrate-binding protein [Stackebrandtia endophytica]